MRSSSINIKSTTSPRTIANGFPTYGAPGTGKININGFHRVSFQHRETLPEAKTANTEFTEQVQLKTLTLTADERQDVLYSLLRYAVTTRQCEGKHKAARLRDLKVNNNRKDRTPPLQRATIMLKFKTPHPLLKPASRTLPRHHRSEISCSQRAAAVKGGYEEQK